MTYALISPEVAAYLDSLTPDRPATMLAMEALARDEDFPIIGPVCGQICYLAARLLQARRIFELGSGFGYSTAWFAKAVRENGGGTVHHTVWDSELSARARAYLTELGYTDLVNFSVGESVALLSSCDQSFDLIFMDIDKEGYPGALAAIEQKLRPGGLLIVDNLLWQGRIFDPANGDTATEGVRGLTRMLHDSPRWSWSLLPVRDGFGLAYKLV
jgi:caffeoyl-CoA O-methyltransferase